MQEKELQYASWVAKVSSLEKSIHDHAGSRESRLKDLEKKIKTVKGQTQSLLKDLKVGIVINSSGDSLATCVF